MPKTPDKVTDWMLEWKDVEFYAELEVFSYRRGRSSAVVMAHDGVREYIIFLTDYFDMLRNGDIKDNIITGDFIIKKRGRNLGVRLKKTLVTSRNKFLESLIPEYI